MASATWKGFVAPGTANNVMASNGTDWTSQAPATGALVALVPSAGSGTNFNFAGGAANIATCTISGLTSRDRLRIYAEINSNDGQAASYIFDDGTTQLGTANGTSGLLSVHYMELADNPGSGTTWGKVEGTQGSTLAVGGSQSHTASWTGTWTLRFRCTGGSSTSNGWFWTVHKIVG